MFYLVLCHDVIANPFVNITPHWCLSRSPLSMNPCRSALLIKLELSPYVALPLASYTLPWQVRRNTGYCQ